MEKVTRKIQPKIVEQLEKETILILIGSRQVGKTTLIKQCKEILEKRKKTVSYFTLEDNSLLDALDEHPKNIFKYIKENNPDKQFLLLDEIQYLKNPSNFLKYLYDEYKDQLKIICTGSSAFYIDKKFKDSLAGRKRIIKVYPFSFVEFLGAKAPKLSKLFLTDNYLKRSQKRSFLIPEKRELEQLWEEYSIYGGYPRVVLETDTEEKKMLLKELHQSFLKKDIFESGVKDEVKFYKLIKLIASQCGELLNQNELANTLGLSRTAVEHYLYVLQKSFILEICPTFQSNLRKELTKMPKVFMLDSGYRNSLLGCFETIFNRADGGATFENLFYIAILKSGVEDIKFWRTQDNHEVDFVIDEKKAFECKLSAKKYKESKYKRFRESYPDIPLKLIVPEDDDEVDIFDFCS